MSRKILLAVAATLLSAPMAFADAHEAIVPTGDAEAGEAAFRQCIACHVVVDEAGETLAGRNSRTGPNLYDVAGRPIGSIEDFRYSDGLTALNELEMTWTEEDFVGYVQDPTGWIREVTEDNSLRGAMSFRVRSEEDALDLYAYLHSLANPAE